LEDDNPNIPSKTLQLRSDLEGELDVLLATFDWERRDNPLSLVGDDTRHAADLESVDGGLAHREDLRGEMKPRRSARSFSFDSR
jgi:hypothetical protein